VTYLDVMVARFPGGRVGVEDVVWVEDGDSLAEMVRHAVLPAAALRDAGMDARLGEMDRLFVANSKKVQDLIKASRARKWQEVITLYKGLPAGLQHHKPILFKYAEACVHVGRAEGTAALETCRKRFPGDPALDILTVGYHLERDEYRAAMRGLDAMKAWTGDDALLDAIRAVSLTKSGQLKEARAVAERSVAADPELKLAYISRILVAIEEQNHADTLEWLKKTVENTRHDFGDLRQVPLYAPFVQSPEFRQWIAWRATRHER
jgi:tetratricopeptide (TPR) repeat protein